MSRCEDIWLLLLPVKSSVSITQLKWRKLQISHRLWEILLKFHPWKKFPSSQLKCIISTKSSFDFFYKWALNLHVSEGFWFSLYKFDWHDKKFCEFNAWIFSITSLWAEYSTFILCLRTTGAQIELKKNHWIKWSSQNSNLHEKYKRTGDGSRFFHFSSEFV